MKPAGLYDRPKDLSNFAVITQANFIFWNILSVCVFSFNTNGTNCTNNDEYIVFPGVRLQKKIYFREKSISLRQNISLLILRVTKTG